jgi:hypothetical protein
MHGATVLRAWRKPFPHRSTLTQTRRQFVRVTSRDKINDAYVHAPFDPSDERVQQEVEQPESRAIAALRVLQLLQEAHQSEGCDSGYGGGLNGWCWICANYWRRRSRTHLINSAIAASSAPTCLTPILFVGMVHELTRINFSISTPCFLAASVSAWHGPVKRRVQSDSVAEA